MPMITYRNHDDSIALTDELVDHLSSRSSGNISIMPEGTPCAAASASIANTTTRSSDLLFVQRGVGWCSTQMGKHKRFLLIGCLLQIFTIIVVLVMVKQTYDATTRCPPSINNDTVASKLEDKVCTSPDCIRLAVYMLSIMNASADPCDDFYEYACGGFRAPYLLKNDVYSVGDKIRQLLVQEVWYTLNKIHNKKIDLNTLTSSDSLYWKQAELFLYSCIDASTRVETFMKELIHEVITLKSKFNITKSADYLDKYQTMIIHMWQQYSISPFFKWRAQFHSAKKSTMNIEPRSEIYLAKLGEPILIVQTIHILQSYGLDLNCSGKHNSTCIDKYMNDVVWVANALRTLSHNISDYKSEYISNSRPFDLEEIGQKLFRDYKKFILSPKSDQIAKFVSSLSAEKFENFVIWTIIYTYIRGSDLKITGAYKPREAEEQCLSTLLNYVPNVLFRSIDKQKGCQDKLFTMIGKAHFSNNSIRDDRKVKDYRNTVETTLQKLRSTYEIIGLEMKLGDVLEINKRTRMHKSFLKNIINLTKKQELDNIYDVEAKNFFDFFKVAVNEKFLYFRLPQSIDQSPLFSQSNPSDINVPLLGSLVYSAAAHYLLDKSEVLDNNREFRDCVEYKFDDLLPKKPSYGDNVDLLIRKDIQPSMLRSHSFHYVLHETAALSLTHDLWKSRNKEGVGLKLPRYGALPRDEDQLFFLSFAQARCQYSEQTPDSLVKEWQTMPHKMMINRMMSLNPHARKAFKCDQRQYEQCVPKIRHGRFNRTLLLYPSAPQATGNILGSKIESI